MSHEVNSDEHVWQAFRAQMPVTRRWAYLDNAAVAPLSGPASSALAAWARESTEEGASEWGRWANRVEQTRQAAATLIGADEDEISLVQNTTAGISIVAEGFPWQSGDNVVVPAGEFPSNLYPWMNLADRGVETRRVSFESGRLDLNRLAEACDNRTRIVAASWVGYAGGWRSDVAELAKMAHDQGALLFLDAIQGLGIFPIDVVAAGVDFLASDGHKWLLATEGAGILYIKQEHLERLRPHGVGWNSVVQGHNFSLIDLNLRPSAGRFEGGSQNIAGYLALGASLEMLQSIGMENLSRRVLQLNAFACDRLQAAGAEIMSCQDPQHASGILSFKMPGVELAGVRRRMKQHGIILNVRDGRLRTSHHAYNSEEDFVRTVEALQQDR